MNYHRDSARQKEGKVIVLVIVSVIVETTVISNVKEVVLKM